MSRSSCGCGSTSECRCIIDVENCATIRGSGSDGNPYIIGVQVDEVQGDNQLACGPDGLYVPPQGDGDARTSFATENTNTVSHTLIGDEIAGYTLSSNVRLVDDGDVPNPDSITPSPGNLLKEDPIEGLYVSCEDVADCIGQHLADGLEYVDGDNEINVLISDDTGNQASFSVTDGGIYVPSPSPTPPVFTDNCIEGDGSPADPVRAVLDPDATNRLECSTGPSADGLYVPPVVTDNCIVGTGTALDPVRALIAPNPTAAGCDNSLECTAEGLYVHVPRVASFRTQNTGFFDAFMPSTDVTSSSYPRGGDPQVAITFTTFADDGLNENRLLMGQFTNPDACCPMIVTLDAGLPNQGIRHNDVCAAVDAYLAAGGTADFGIRLDQTHQWFIGGVSAGSVDSRVLRIRYNSDGYSGPGTGATNGCGIQIGTDEGADNENVPITVPAGGTVPIEWRAFIRLAVDGAGVNLNDPPITAFLNSLFAGQRPYDFENGNPGEPKLSGENGAKIFGVSSCRDGAGDHFAPAF